MRHAQKENCVDLSESWHSLSEKRPSWGILPKKDQRGQEVDWHNTLPMTLGSVWNDKGRSTLRNLLLKFQPETFRRQSQGSSRQDLRPFWPCQWLGRLRRADRPPETSHRTSQRHSVVKLWLSSLKLESEPWIGIICSFSEYEREFASRVL